jgi:asparagine synthase (glutamine-hydrolysing)
MCGIWALILENERCEIKDFNKLIHNFNEIKNRGPDFSSFETFNETSILGFHRLSIMDKSDKGLQPFYFETEERKMALICNGEIYNYKSLINEYELDMKSKCDCEIILQLYYKVGINKLLNLLDGVFAFVIIDIKKKMNERKVIVARDKIGVRPLFYGWNEEENENEYYFCSEIKGLSRLVDKIEIFKPATYMELNYNNGKLINKKIEEYYKYNYEMINLTEKQHMINIKEILIQSVKKRLQSDRPLCCLLSGGLDSSLISSITSRLLKETNNKLYTFSIGMQGSTDNVYATKVAEYIKSEHTVIWITKEESLKAIYDVIYATETYDITTIRASVGQYLISKYISNNTDYKVILSGDGSDEVASGYIYNYNAPSLKDLQNEAIKRIKEIHIYDGLRADRATSIHGLELRVPFLDTKFVDYYLSIDPELRMPKKKRMEKFLLRKSFEGFLPNDILYRKKEAFSDGISSKEDSWHIVIQKYINEKITEEEYNLERNKYKNNTPMTKEAYYYRKIFCEIFDNKYNNVIKDFWLPNWCGDVKEPSARILSVYNEEENNEEYKNEEEILKKKLV